MDQLVSKVKLHGRTISLYRTDAGYMVQNETNSYIETVFRPTYEAALGVYNKIISETNA